ncbi:MAG: M28 family peptidase [Clostridiales bacterium]|nr:M28 family peptidase [Clostridiales bacterium]
MQTRKFALLSWVLVFALVFSLGLGVSGKEAFAGSSSRLAGVDIANEVESFCSDGGEVLQEVVEELSKKFGSRYYGTRLEKDAAEYVANRFAEYLGAENTAAVGGKAHFHPNNTDHPNYPGLIYIENHRVGGVVELASFGEDYGYDIVGRSLPSYDFYDMSVANAYVSFDGEFKGTDKGGFSGVFWDFGLQGDLNVEGLSELPAETDVYGALRLTSNINPSAIAGIIESIEDELDGGAVTGLYIADNRLPAIPSNLWASGNSSGNHRYGMPFVRSAAWAEQTDVSAVTMSLFDLERLVGAAEIGTKHDKQPVLGRTYNHWAETTYVAYGVIPAETEDPDLVIVVTAHLDGVACSPSANDDGSGVAALVEIARRMADVHTGSVEVIFAAVGGEEHSDHNGAFWVIDELLTAKGKDAIAINLNMDMIATGADAVRSNGNAVNSFTFSIVNRLANAFNLPLYLVVENYASWGKFSSQPDFITTHSISRSSGYSIGYDHGAFGYYNIENFGLYHPLEYQYHSSLDNMTNYSIDRHRYGTNIIHAAILKAINDQVSKRAHFNVTAVGDVVEAKLAGADSMFVTYDRVTADFVGETTSTATTLEFSPGSTVHFLPKDNYAIQNVSGYATASVPDPSVLTTTLNRSFASRLAADILHPTFNLSVPAESGIEGDVCYTLSISKAENVLSVELEFEIDGDLLAGKGLVGLNGFDPLNDIFWAYAGSGKWKGAATLGLPSGSTTGLTSAPPTDIAQFVFSPRAVGEATMKLTSAKAVGVAGGTTAYLNSVIESGEATTFIDQRVFSKYDLNRDNKVDALDLGIMLLYCGFDKDSPAWDTLVKVNDSRGKGVTASMCDVNGDGVIDMLDLLDLFIHYTK